MFSSERAADGFRGVITVMVVDILQGEMHFPPSLINRLSSTLLDRIPRCVVWMPSAKAEHESGLPMAHYRYTHGKTCEYVNLWIRVTQWLKPAQIQVGLPEYQVLVPGTCKYLCQVPYSFFCHLLIFIHSRCLFCIK